MRSLHSYTAKLNYCDDKIIITVKTKNNRLCSNYSMSHKKIQCSFIINEKIAKLSLGDFFSYAFWKNILA